MTNQHVGNKVSTYYSSVGEKEGRDNKLKQPSMMTAILVLSLAPAARCYAPVSKQAAERSGSSGPPPPMVVVPRRRRDVLKIGSVFVASVMLGGRGPPDALAEEDNKIYSSNARNMARLGNGDSSGGSVYDNDPTSPKARARRAMVGCKNSSARSLAGEKVSNGRQLSEKECNRLVMSGDSEFMLGALTELDCPTCPYGIGSR